MINLSTRTVISHPAVYLRWESSNGRTTDECGARLPSV